MIPSFVQHLPSDLRKAVLAFVPAHNVSAQALSEWWTRFGVRYDGCVVCREPSNGGSVWVGRAAYRIRETQGCKICASCFLSRPVVYVPDGRGLFRRMKRKSHVPVRNARIRVPGHGLVECYELELSNVARVVFYADQSWDLQIR